MHKKQQLCSCGDLATLYLLVSKAELGSVVNGRCCHNEACAGFRPITEEDQRMHASSAGTLLVARPDSVTAMLESW